MSRSIAYARGGSKIEQWLGSKPAHYWGARKRTRIALNHGTLKGVLWHQGESNSDAPDNYLEHLKSLIANLRTDFGDTDLPFVAGQIHNSPAINAQIAKLPEVAHATACVTSDGFTATDRWHFDTGSQLLLGERYAEQMIKLQLAQEDAEAPKPPSDIRFIDTHVHAMAVKDGGLDAVAKWMKERNVERCIVSPLNHKGSRAWTGEERRTMLANYRKYAREFIIRNADKVLFGTDEGWWSFGSRKKQMNQHYTFFEELDLPDAVRYKLYRGNAEKLFGWGKNRK